MRLDVPPQARRLDRRGVHVSRLHGFSQASHAAGPRVGEVAVVLETLVVQP
jgi:hypothetical protein